MSPHSTSVRLHVRPLLLRSRGGGGDATQTQMKALSAALERVRLRQKLERAEGFFADPVSTHAFMKFMVAATDAADNAKKGGKDWLATTAGDHITEKQVCPLPPPLDAPAPPPV